MNAISDIFSSDFLLRNSIYVSVATGLVCPIAGIYLILRRMVFLGVALPQVSAFGIALALAMHIWFGHAPESHIESDRLIAYIGSIAISAISIIYISVSEKKGKTPADAKLGAIYAVAMALSIVVLAKCPVAESGWLSLLKGEIVSVSDKELLASIIGLSVVAFCFWRFNREFILVSFDREMAITLKKNVTIWNSFLLLLIGITIAISVLSVGPLIAFGFSIIPPLIARQFASNMRQFITLSSLTGGISAFVGFCLAYKYDLPVGPVNITLLGILYVVSSLMKNVYKVKVLRTTPPTI